MTHKTQELAIAVQAATRAGKIVKDGYHKLHSVSRKADKSFVSEIDREAEEAILSVLSKNFPGHRFISEESGPSGQESDYKWFIDPLDGTGNYLAKIPIFYTAICLVYKDKPILSVAYNGLQEELFTASLDHGAFLNDSSIKVSKNDDLPLSSMIFARGRTQESKQRFAGLFVNIVPQIRTVRVFGSAVANLAYLARGSTDAVANQGNELWDYIGGVLLVQEAGGMVTGFSGEPWDINQNEILATNGTRLHQKLLAIIKA